MACIDFQIKIFDQYGNFIEELVDYESFEITRIKNDIGTFTIVLNALNHKITDYRADYRAEVYRKGKLVGDTCWFLQRKELTTQNNKDTITLIFADTIDILSRRINAWYSCDNPQCFGALWDIADDLMKMVVRFNFGDLVDPLSDPVTTPLVSTGASPVDVQGVPPAVSLAYNEIYGDLSFRRMDFTIEEYKGQGIVIPQEISFIDVLTILQDTASASQAVTYSTLQHNIWFDIVYTPATLDAKAEFLFKTWVGRRNKDLRNKVFIGPDFANLADATYIDDYSQRADIAYVLSDGDNSTQVVGSAYLDLAQNAYYYNLPFGPVEIVTDFPQDNASEDLLEGEGLTALGNASKTKSLDGTIITSKNFDFMEHFNYGDILSLRWNDVIEDIEIAEFTITVDENGVESIDVPLTIL